MADIDIVQLLTLIIITIGAIIALKQLRDQHEWYRREKALSFSSVYHPELQKMKVSLEKNFSIVTGTESIPRNDIIEKIEKDPELLINLYSVLNYYECASIACFRNIADEDILFDLISGTLISYRKKLMDFIEYRRDQSKNPNLWINLQMLSIEWEKRKNKSNINKSPKIG